MFKNQVLSDDFVASSDFYQSDAILQHFIKTQCSPAAQVVLQPQLHYTGKMAAGEMNEWSLLADKEPPQLIKRDFLGRNIDKIQFHPAYTRLSETAVHSGMFWLKWQPELRQRFVQERHRMGFSVGFLFAMSEAGLYCPLCMTDGVALLLDKYADEADKARLLPRIYTQNPQQLYTGAMFLTEKAGGSDVGANLVLAKATEEPLFYELQGEKWFCSNANADIIFALARTDAAVQGTKGLSIFLVERNLPDGSRNPMDLLRLKDKLGVRSMASAEYIFENTRAKLVGKEFEGFKIMADMINLSRMYNSVTAVALSRRAIIEAYQFLKYRSTFGKNALQHALIRSKLTELSAIYTANFYLTWRCILAMDNADNGDKNEQELLRLLTPITKKMTAQDGVYLARESMELMGGLGYIEDGVMPKIMRDMMVLPIWEGAGNIMVLDVLRALWKSQGWALLAAEIRRIANKNNHDWLAMQIDQLEMLLSQLKTENQDQLEASARPWVERLARIYQIALLLHYTDNISQDWTKPALDFLIKSINQPHPTIEKPLDIGSLEKMIAWGMVG